MFSTADFHVYQYNVGSLQPKIGGFSLYKLVLQSLLNIGP